MDQKSTAAVPDRPGKTSFWTSRAPVQVDSPETVPGSTQPPSLGVGTLDNVRSVFWQAYRHLFPPHSLAAQSPGGSLVISWSILDEPNARYPYAAPVMLRFDDALVDTMWKADSRQRVRIAQNHEPTLREGLRGYDPFARFPNARVITIG
jgi:hypothetical protein